MPRPASRLRCLASGRRLRVLLAALAVLAAVAALDAFWIEPRLLLVRDEVAVDLVPGRYRVVHLSDLHVERGIGLYERLLRRVAAEEPDLVLVSGDLVADVHDTQGLLEHARAAADWVARLRPVAPVLAVQGHSDYLGEVVGALAAGGVEWLHNEGRRIGPEGPGGDLLLLGLSQQVGHDEGGARPPVFRAGTVEGEPVVVARPRGTRNAYLSWDPDGAGPGGLASAAGALAWSGYDALVSVRVDRPETGAGLTVHARHVLGEDRSIRLARAKAWPEDSGTFALTFNGTAPTAAELDTGVAPEPGRWYRMRMRIEVAPEAVRVSARVWPAGEAEPAQWQAWAEDRSPGRIEAGTVALWTWGEGSVAYRDLRVVDRPEGSVLLETSLADADGFREGTRGTRLEMAVARSPEVPPGTPRIVLTHSPDSVVEAARRGVRLVLAGHTHGGQVRLPFVGALITRTDIGRRYDRGLFRWPAPGRPEAADSTLLYVNAGVGTSILPVRFFDPPTYAVFDF